MQQSNTDAGSGSVSREEAIAAVKTLLTYIGVDLNDEHLRDTPARVVKSYAELFEGYRQDASAILSSRTYSSASYGQQVALGPIDFVSTCAHHMLPVEGKAWVSYIPKNSIVGISKLARVVEANARKLQIQEHMTKQIAEQIQESLDPQGVALKIVAKHYCMIARGVKSRSAELATQYFTGEFLRDQALRKEFLKGCSC